MPSPIAHLTAGYALYALGRSRLRQSVAPVPRSLFVALGFSMLPDMDSVLGLLAGDFGRFHNNATHSLLIGLIVALGFGLWLRQRRNPNAGTWFFLALLGYELHILMDSATLGRGVMAWWPLSADRYNLPIPLFFGFRWSDGLWSMNHVVTVVTELLFAGVVALLLHLLGVVKIRRGTNRTNPTQSLGDSPPGR